MKKEGDATALKILNWLSLIAMVAVATLADTLPIGGKTTRELGDLHPNLFSPAGFTFNIWTLIYVLMTLFCIYQIVHPPQKERSTVPLVKRVGPYFSLSAILNAAWIIAWHYQMMLLSLLAMALLLLALIAAYMRIDNRAVTAYEKWMVRVPFSVYLAWVCIATISNLAAAVNSAGWNRWGVSEEAFTVVLLGIAAAAAFGVLLAKGDIAFAVVFIWAFVGIWAKHVGLFESRYGVVLIASAIVIVLLAVESVVVFSRNLLAKRKALRSAQTQP